MKVGRRITIAIDGPSASGKSTTARMVARRLGYTYIDTGAMYRALTWAAINEGIAPVERERLADLARRVSIELGQDERRTLVSVNGENVSEEIRQPEVTRSVSEVSAHRDVRERMVELQRELGRSGGVVLDGRDIGTVVFPEAELKIFLVADIDARARRRREELRSKGVEMDEEMVAIDLAERDRKDEEREESPLRAAEDAVRIDTSGLTIEEQVEQVIRLAEQVGTSNSDQPN